MNLKKERNKISKLTERLDWVFAFDLDQAKEELHNTEVSNVFGNFYCKSKNLNNVISVLKEIKNIEKRINHFLMQAYQCLYMSFQLTELKDPQEKESIDDYEKRVIENTKVFKQEEIQNNKELLKIFTIAENVYFKN